jgi:hypothetical protein
MTPLISTPQLEAAQRAHRAAMQSLASHLCDVAQGDAELQGQSVAELLHEIDGGDAIDDDTLDRIAGGPRPVPPGCDECAHLGFAVFNGADDGSGGDIQRCDNCGTFRNDDQAIHAAANALGELVADGARFTAQQRDEIYQVAVVLREKADLERTVLPIHVERIDDSVVIEAVSLDAKMLTPDVARRLAAELERVAREVEDQG